MNNRDYEPAQANRFLLSPGVEMVSKSKQCGKENCRECPHEGYWYAVIQSFAAAAGKRSELYIGREWTQDELAAKITPALATTARAALEHTIAQVLRDERAAELRDQIADIAATLKAISAEAQRDRAEATRNYEAQVKHITTTEKQRIAQLTTNQKRAAAELATLKKGTPQ